MREMRRTSPETQDGILVVCLLTYVYIQYVMQMCVVPVCVAMDGVTCGVSVVNVLVTCCGCERVSVRMYYVCKSMCTCVASVGGPLYLFHTYFYFFSVFNDPVGQEAGNLEVSLS